MIRIRKSTLIYLICALWLLALNKASMVMAQPLEKPTLSAIQLEFQQQWEGKDIRKKEVTKGKGWKQFKRWESFMESRVNKLGKFPQSGILWTEALESGLFSLKKSDLNKWQPIGPMGAAGNISNPTEIMGAGRIDCIAFHPTDENTFFIGTPSGGVWKTTDHGVTWASITDKLPTMAISDIEIDRKNPATMYLATGDRDSWSEEQNQQFGGYSVGILKSVDGGNSWQLTGLNFKVADNLMVNDLLINSENSDVLTAATNLGIYRSTNAGETWNRVSSGYNVKDIKQHPTNANIVYAGTANSYGYAKILKSVNAGQNFTEITTEIAFDAGRFEIAVTPANPLAVFVLKANAADGSFGGLYKSENAGETWTQITGSRPINLFDWDYSGGGIGGQGSYDIALAVDPTNENIIRVGAINIWKTETGGSNWEIESYWIDYQGNDYVHADQHALEYNPLNNALFAGNDGGIYNFNAIEKNWIDISSNLSILQVYRIGLSATNKELVLSGNQDNGTYKRGSDGTWNYIVGGDGMECLFDYTDENTIYSEYYYGNITRSTDGGLSYLNISPTYGNSAWITPFVMHPTQPNILFLGGNGQLFKTENRGDSWTIIAELGNTNLQSLAICKTQPDVIYTASFSNIWVSKNGGTEFTNITIGLPTANITYIAVSDTDPNKVWITLSGFMRGEKVYYSGNAGETWQNMSDGLPNVPANSIVHLAGSQADLYLATDLGVFYRNQTMQRWVPFNNGLPPMIVHEIEIQYATNKLFAGTYGRGIWAADLYTMPETDLGVAALLNETKGNNLTNTELLKVKIQNYGTQTLTSFKVWYQLNNNPPVGEQVTAEIKPGELFEYTFTQAADLSEAGIYNFNFFTEVTGDANLDNNKLETEIRNYRSDTNPENGNFALNFSGQNHYVDCGNAPSLNIAGEFTLEAWINPLNWGEMEASGFGRIIDKGSINVLLNGDYPYYNLHSLLVIITTETGSVIANTAAESLVLGEWQHIAVVYDAQKSVRVFVNGLEQEVIISEANFGPLADNLAYKLILGENRTLTRSFNGLIDEVRLWNTVRNQNQIRLNACSINPATEGLAGYWRFNEGTGSPIATDLSGKGNHGFLENFNIGSGTNSDWQTEYHNCYAANLSIESVNKPITSNLLTDNELIAITVRNKGSEAVSEFEISYTLNNLVPVKQIVTETVEAFSEKEIQFTVPANFAEKGLYTLQTQVNFATDQQTTDNSLTYHVANHNYCYAYAGTTGERPHMQKVSFAGKHFKSNYSGHSIQTTPVDIHLNKNYTIEITPVGMTENDTCLIAIDWNADSDFADENELFPAELRNGKFYATFQGEKSGFQGKTLMRIAYVQNATELTSVCGTFEVGEVEDYYINTLEPLNATADILSFNVENQIGETVIDTDAAMVTVFMPKGTELFAIVPNFTLSQNAKAFLWGSPIVSGETALDFSYPLEFVVLAEDETHKKFYTVNVRYELSDQAEFMSFAMPGQINVSRISKTNREILVNIGTTVNLSALGPQFNLSSGAKALVDNIEQVSGESTNDFSKNVLYTVISENQANQIEWTVKVSKPTGINQNANENIKLYPNPTQEYIIIENAENAEVEIWTTNGKLVQTEKTASNSHYINLTNIASGRYIVILRNKEFVFYSNISVSK
ncbi:MAG TPA: hypothetical protein DCQ31_00230 [Bacteroidales bacterium]|nr:hypothetical protein [Bacteroidales bacterium]